MAHKPRVCLSSKSSPKLLTEIGLNTGCLISVIISAFICFSILWNRSYYVCCCELASG